MRQLWMLAAALALLGSPRMGWTLPGQAETAVHAEDDGATLVLGEDLAGRFVVHTANGDLVAEVHKREGQTASFSLEAGRYEVRCSREDGRFLSIRELEPGERVVLAVEDFEPDAEALEGQTESGLLLTEDLEGRFVVRNAGRELVADLFKPLGRRVLLGLEPGVYEVRSEGEAGPLRAVAAVGEDEELPLAPEDFDPAEVGQGARPPAAADGSGLGPLSGRNRLELRFGVWEKGASAVWVDHGGTHTSASSENASFSVAYSHWLSEHLAVTLTATALSGRAEFTSGNGWESTDCDGVGSLLLGARQYLGGTESLKPFVEASVGPYFSGSATTDVRVGDEEWTDARSVAAPGGYAGAGVDVRVGRSWTLSVAGGYNFMSDFSSPVGGRDNYSGWDAGIGLSWLFGKGEPREWSGLREAPERPHGFGTSGPRCWPASGITAGGGCR